MIKKFNLEINHKFQFGMDLQAMSIDLKQADMVETIAGVSFVFTASTIFVMFVASVFAGKSQRSSEKGI